MHTTHLQTQKIVNIGGLVGKKDKVLSVSNYQYILKNPIYYGVIRYNGEMYNGKHEPIITKRLFDTCQEVMRNKSKPKGNKLKPYIYRGVFRCGECGCFITTETQKGHNYLRCTKRKVKCSQKYMREEEMTEQIRTEIQKVSLCSAWANNCLNELAKEMKEKAQAESSFVQKHKDQLVVIESKLDALLDLQLNGAVTQDEYIAKKQKIINHKVEIFEKLNTFERKSNNRFEPIIEFIKEVNQAENIALHGNPSECRDFLKNIGSNLAVAEAKLSVPLKNPWKIAAKWCAHARGKGGESFQNQKSEIWRRFLNEVRIFFEKNPLADF